METRTKNFIGIRETRKRLQLSPLEMDDQTLKMYHQAAIKATLRLLGRTKYNLIKTFHGVPRDINDAIIILIKSMLAAGHTKLYIANIPYEFDEKLRDYIQL